MKKNLKLFFHFTIVMILAGFCQEASADVRMPRIFSDHMVLQRDAEVVVWGWAGPRERVKVSIGSQEHTTRADRQGNWSVKLQPMKAGGPHTLTVIGKNQVIFSDILIGEVWLGSGQSNMQWSVAQSANPEEEILLANYPNIRLFSVPRRIETRPVNDLEEGEWQVCSPENISSFSAVAYYFGRHLHRELGVPVGLIHSSWGGTVAETWISRETMLKHEDFFDVVQNGLPLGDQEITRPNSFPSLLFNGMINPILPYTIKGAIWYQGEANAGRAYQYRALFPGLIEDWRNKWNNPGMPFLFVQLANFRAPSPMPVDSDWAELREAQTMTLSLPFTGMAVIIDIGEANDIHPRNKQDVGLRLALNALKIAYNKDIVYSGPVFNSMSVEGDRVRLTFDHVGSGLMINDKYGYLKGFAIAGADRVFHWTKATLEGNEVVVYSDKVDKPVAVRYAWADNPDDANLYNKEGLPASPFRTDGWPGITKGKK